VYSPIVHTLSNQELLDLGFTREDGEFERCKFVDDYGFSAPKGCENAKLFVLGNEYGYTHLVHSQHESDAHSAWLDTCTTIEPSEVPEAYNAYDKLLERMEAKGHENDGQLRDFCNRWAGYFYHADTNEGNNWDSWDLDEAYQYQSNSTGTGIVNIGHNTHSTEIKWSQLKAVRKVMAS